MSGYENYAIDPGPQVSDEHISHNSYNQFITEAQFQ
jgi:hypothetical protein